MKKYLNPNLEVLKMDAKDVVATSIQIDPPEGGDNDTPAVGIPLPTRE